MSFVKALLLAAFVCLGQGCLAPKPSQYPCAGNQTIATALKETAKKHRVPALGGAVITDRGEIWVGVVGTRSIRGGEPVTLEDLWHIATAEFGANRLFQVGVLPRRGRDVAVPELQAARSR